MAKKDNQISDEELQLYLSGELDLETSEKLKEIEREVVLKKNTNKEDAELVNRIHKFREVDKIIAETLETKYPMPEAFSKEIATELSKLDPKRSILSDIADKSKEKISAFKVGISSALGGAALTAIGASLFFSLQTSVVTRGDINEIKPSSIASENGWIVLDGVALRITNLGNDKKGKDRYLTKGGSVKIGDEYLISTISLNNFTPKIYYKSEKENSKSVLQENRVYQFQNPAGKDRIIIELEKDFYEIEINVSE